MALANELEVSHRHLNYLENNKTAGSRDLLVRLSEHLSLSLRARNSLLVASGFAPMYPQSSLSAEEDSQARKVLSFMLEAAEPYPALIIDPRLRILMHNSGLDRVIDTFAANPKGLREGGLTIPRLNFHEDGLRAAIVNIEETISAHLGRLHRALETVEFDREDVGYHTELKALAETLSKEVSQPQAESPHLVIPVELAKGDQRIRLFTAITTLGSPRDVTMQELQVDTGFPMDEESAAFFRNVLT